MRFDQFAQQCGNRLVYPQLNRLKRRNGASVLPRCQLKPPAWLPGGVNTTRWLMSTPDTVSFGQCSAECPRRTEWNP